MHQFGEVWIASGQSNMHWTFSHDIRDKERELDAVRDPLLRRFTADWRVATANRSRIFSSPATTGNSFRPKP